MRSYGGAFGLVDAMRVGPDNGGGDWKSVLTGPQIASRHYHLNGRIWYNDPDVVYVRPSLSLDQARANTSWVSITGQLFMVSDDFTKLKPERLEVLKRVMPAHGQHVAAGRSAGRRDSADLAGDRQPRRPAPRRHRAVQLGREALGRSTIRWTASGCRRPSVSRPSTSGATGSCRRSKAGSRSLCRQRSCMILAMRPETDHPQVISTSRARDARDGRTA